MSTVDLLPLKRLSSCFLLVAILLLPGCLGAKVLDIKSPCVAAGVHGINNEPCVRMPINDWWVHDLVQKGPVMA